jgi:hypothetical protein
MSNIIPLITHPMGRHWDQPPLECILIDDKHALMSKFSFDRLAEYSTSMPSGVYPGKMWKRNQRGIWFLGWYGECEDPTMCTNNWREILIA